MKNKLYLLFICFFATLTATNAQIINGKDTLYGNEWINYSQKYFKMRVAEDGIYRINYNTLLSSGVPLASIKGAQFKVFVFGKEIPVFVSNADALQNSDYIEFFAKKNRGELDAELFLDPANEQMNPRFSMFSDTLSYFLTWSANTSLAFANTANNLSNLPQKETSYIHRSDSTFFGFNGAGSYDKQYFKTDGDKIYNSLFEKCEGFASPYSNNRKISIKLNGALANVAPAKLNLRLGFKPIFTGDAILSSNIPIYDIKWNSLTLKTDTLANAFAVKNYSLDIPATQVNNAVDLFISNTKGDHRIATLEVLYPKSFDFENKKSYTFEIAASAQVKYLEIQNFDLSGANIVLYDLSNNLRIVPTIENKIVKIALPPSNIDRKLFLVNETAVKKIDLNETNFVNFYQQKGNYIIVSNKSLYKDANNNNENWVSAYANYRASTEGGAYKTVIVESEQLYDQFAYGVDYHSISIRNFALFAAKYWKPKYMFLIGKGLEYNAARDPDYIKNFRSYLTVPTFGYPGSDNLITATKWSIFQKMPIGRIPVNTPDDIRIYLKKMKEFEQIQRDAKQNINDKLWMKNVVHMAGDDGNFDNALKNMGNILKENLFGANISQFFKTSSDPVQNSNSEVLRNRIKTGASIVNYYGHSASTNVGFSLDSPTELDNKGRYFYYLAHGCYTGQAHVPPKTIGPNYIFQEDGGAIAFCAPSSYGLTGILDNYGNTFYSVIGGSKHGQGVGDATQAVIQNLGFGNGGSNGMTSLLNNMTLQGDPALKLSVGSTPDYIIDPASFKFEPEVVTVLTEKFLLKCTAYNLGRNNNDTFSISLFRELPDGSKLFVKKDTIKGLRYGKDLSFTVNGIGENSAGLNKFYFKIDADNKVAELPMEAETNNDAVSEIRIRSNDVGLVAPQNFTITNQDVTLFAVGNTANNKNATQKYIIEIDTTGNFNSVIKQRKEIVQNGGLMTWKPTMKYQDSTVYYWRASTDSSNTVGYNWKNYSFIYMKKYDNGWNQSHFFQFTDNNYDFIDLLKKDRKFRYQGNSTGIGIRNNYEDVLRPGVQINEVNSSFFKPTLLAGEGAGVLCWVFNDTTGLPWINQLSNGKGLYNSDLNGGTYQPKDYFFPYRTTLKNTRADLINFLEKIVPSKSYVVFMLVTTKAANYKPQLWAADSIAAGDKNLFNVLEKQGAKKIRNILTVGAVPYFYFYRKDDPTFISAESIYNLNQPDKTIGHSAEIKGFWYKGSVASKTIGPAQKWNSILWKQSDVEAKDSTSLKVYGVKKDNSATLLFKENTLKNIDISGVDSKTYPFLKLEWFTRDSINRSSPQLDYWRVLYKGVPESVPNTSKLFAISADTLQQGQLFNLAFAIQNVSAYDMKNMLVRYTLKKSDNSKTVLYQRLKPLVSGDTLVARLNYDTRDLFGKNSISVQINPENDQTEQDTSNNGLYHEFFVEKDKRNPLVDVTFDGQRILNGDIISAEPNIVINLKDENKYLLLEDTSLLKIFLRSPGNDTALRVAFNSNLVKFNPAMNAKNNNATVEFNPKFVKDGNYQLIVRARDVTGNKTTLYEANPNSYNYKVDFRVISKPSISNVLNYPNPFTTSTHFVYTLTGKEPPAYFKIQIMTISGKVVRELTQTDLGPLRTGEHQTEQAWDGTDTYGDRLANGVYLYKMIAKKANGEDYDSYKPENGGKSADDFLKNGIGKLVILR